MDADQIRLNRRKIAETFQFILEQGYHSPGLKGYLFNELMIMDIHEIKDWVYVLAEDEIYEDYKPIMEEMRELNTKYRTLGKISY